MALIKGRSDSPDLERLAHLIHLACFALRVWIYWEYIPSKSNWADAISRLGENNPWYKTHGFVLSQAHYSAHSLELALLSCCSHLRDDLNALGVKCVGCVHS